MLTLEGHIKVRLNGLVSRRRKKFEVTLTEDWVLSTLQRQNFACAATRVALSFDPVLGPRSMSFDRIDGTKGYSKENCRWATPSEQQSNLKNNVVVEYNGQSFTLSQLSRHLGLHWTTLKYRISAGWPQTKWSLPTKKNRSIILSSAD